MPSHFAAILILLVLALNLSARDYFVREDGRDSADGTSAGTAWRSIARVNDAKLIPGDHVLFEAGRSFTGNLHLTADASGTPNAPVVIGSSGDGRAVILAGNGNGITVENAGNIRLENLEIRGAGITNNSGYGILCDNLQTNTARLPNLAITGVDVSGFGLLGILISGVRAGYEHVRVTECSLHDNLRGGMEIAGRLPYDSPVYAHADVVVSNCQAFNNTGDPAFLRHHSGSGVVLYQVDGGAIEKCAAWNNGFMGDNRAGGGVGLWVCASRRVVIQDCESFANKTRGMDGGGFDIDGGCEECVLQYNYSHDNDGPGLMVYNYPYGSFHDRDNIVRFNISENDARRGRNYAGLWVRADGRPMTGLEVYNNTVIGGDWSDQAAFVYGEGVGARLRNNIFIARGGGVPLKVAEPRASLRCEGNLYWRDGGPCSLQWGGTNYTSLEAWRAATGQESARGGAAGLFADPRLSVHGPEEKPFTQVGNAKLLAFQPLSNSPAIGGGLDLASAGQINPGPRDFFGHQLPVKENLVGAFLPAGN